MDRFACILPALLVTAAWAQSVRPFPFFNRGDPKIQTLVFVHRPSCCDLARLRVGVLPFPLPDAVRPGTPPFDAILEQVLLADFAAASTLLLRGRAAGPPEQADEERASLAAALGRAHHADLVVLGRVESLLHRPSGGLVAKVSLRVVSAASGEVVFYGAKKADWIRDYPIEDCFRTLARSFLEELAAPPEPAVRERSGGATPAARKR